jgi:ABC-type Fe3+/spermidine/putrescine transport system ATPase subunit
MLELRDIFKTYDNQPLLRGISFSVAEGETVCLLGASGSGKSTLLRMIAGLENPERGRILFDGLDLAQTPTHLRDFGLVFQDYGLFPHLNIFDNVAFGLKMRNLPAVEIFLRVAALLEKVNLTGFETRKVTDLSGGEQQRVALARALAPQPRLLMFDEPLGALDRTLKESLLQELRSILHETKIPAIYVTHDQDEAFTIADRILLLHEGEIVREGTPAEVWSNPGSAWAARFLDAGNVLDGEIQRMNASREGGRMNVTTRHGAFAVKCSHHHSVGEKISLLVKQSGEVGQEIKLKVEDVLFNREKFQVKADGLIFQLKDAPAIGQVIKVKVEVECLA